MKRGRQGDGGGRATRYMPEFCDRAQKLCVMGATNAELADFFDVAVSTINRWIAKYPKFSGAIKAGKMVADAKVAMRLYELAIGYSHPDEEIFVINNEIVRVPTVRRYPPNTTAAIFFLKNRQPEKWRDTTEVRHSGTVGLGSRLAAALERVKAR